MVSLVHVCDKERKGGCAQRCVKRGDGFFCDCNTGYKLGEDQKLCVKSMLFLFSLYVFSVEDYFKRKESN